MAISVEQFSRSFAAKWGDTMDASMRNYADKISVEMKHRAPYLTGALVRSIKVVKRTDTTNPAYNIVAGVPYAVLRNYVNNLHPQTKHYTEQGVKIAKAGGHKQWWKSLPAS